MINFLLGNNVKRSISILVAASIGYYLVSFLLSWIGYAFFLDWMIEAQYNPKLITICVNIILLFVVLTILSKRRGEKNKVRSLVFFDLCLLSILSLLLRFCIDPILWQEYIVEGLNTPYPYTLRSSSQLLVEFINLIVLVPLVEELFFREYLLGKMMEIGIGKFAGLILSSVLFSLLHFSLFDYSFIPVEVSFILGIVLGVSYLKYGFIASIICHSMYNLIVWLIMFRKAFYYNLIYELNFGFYYWFIICVSAFILIIIVSKLYQRTSYTLPNISN